MASRRLQKRIEAETAEKRGKTAKKTKKKATKKRATRKKTTTRKRKTKTVERKKIYWGVFSGTLKEEGRFAYDQRDKAEEKLEALRNRSTKKLYFIQPIKASLAEATAAIEDVASEDDPKSQDAEDFDADDFDESDDGDSDEEE